MRVLFVDDDDVTLFLYRVLAESTANCVPFYAKDGKEALEVIAQEQEAMDLLFLDINMPVMDGFEFLKRHSQLPEDSQVKNPFVMLGTDISEEKRGRLTQFRIVDCLAKPLRKDLFSDLLMQISK